MPQNVSHRKSSRFLGMAALLGAGAAMLLVGSPADAATLHAAARTIALGYARGI